MYRPGCWVNLTTKERSSHRSKLCLTSCHWRSYFSQIDQIAGERTSTQGQERKNTPTVRRNVVGSELKKYGPEVVYYLMVRPGMTGLWQVSGRNDVDYETRVDLDTWYVKNWALWSDLKILFQTLRVVLKRDGAY